MTFREFWPGYLRAHQRRGTRVAHYLATTLGLGGVAIALTSQRPSIAIAAIILGYGIAVSSHHLFEGRGSLVLVNPVWGAMADLRMCWLALRGGLGAELQRHRARISMDNEPAGAVRSRH